MALVEHGTCKIEKLNLNGLGEGKTQHGSVFLPYVLPSDVAEFERHAYRRKSDTILKNIVEKNAARKNPVCPYFGACGGCLLQHLPEEEYGKFKLRMLEEEIIGIETKILPLITVPFGSRRRANLEAVKKNGQVFLGFHRFHSHQIINLDHCPALLPSISVLIEPLKKVLEEIMEDREKLVLFVTNSAAGVDISVEIHNRTSLEDPKRKVLQEFAEKHDIMRLIFRHRKKIDIIHGSEVPYVIFGGIKVEIDSHCFLQSSDMSDQVLGDMVVKYLKRDNHTGPILDLFCGRGTYTIPLSKYGHIDGFECDAKALKALGEAVHKNKLPITLQQRDLFTYPLVANELTKYKRCIINPPRAGAQEQVKEISRSRIEQMCYVSCNPETFARDAKILALEGYKLLEVTPFDQFYYSPHLEVIGYFER